MKSKTMPILVAVITLSAAAYGDMGGSGSMMFGADPVIAPDGTVLTLRSGEDHEPGSGMMHGEEGMDLIAVTPSGSIAWTYEAGGGIHDIAIVNDLVVIAVVQGDPYGWWDGVDDESTSKVVAVTLAGGTAVWELELEEVVRSLEATTDRIYAVSGMHGEHQGMIGRSIRHPGHGAGHGPGDGPGDGGTGARSLFAIGLDGSLLWTVPLD